MRKMLQNTMPIPFVSIARSSLGDYLHAPRRVLITKEKVEALSNERMHTITMKAFIGNLNWVSSQCTLDVF